MDYNNQNNIPNPGNNPNNGNGYPPGQSPYGNPYRPPARVPGSSFSTAALVCGIISIVSALLMTVYFPFIFGSLAVVFAILSKSRAVRMASQAKTGIVCAIIGLVANITIITASFVFVFSNPDVLRQSSKMYDNMCEQIYGQSSEELFGESMEDFVNDLIEQMQ